jgi:hypothetical protein
VVTDEIPTEAPSPVCPVLLDGLVSQLNELNRTAALEFALRVGSLIVKEIYNGELSRWRAFGERDVSFRQLAARAHVDLRMSATSLYRSLALYELCSRLSTELWRDFGAAHLRAVLGIPEKDQIKLLSVAKVENLSARELDERAAALRGRVQSRRQVKDLPVAKLLRRVLAVLRAPEATITFQEIDVIRNMLAEIEAQIARHTAGDLRQTTGVAQRTTAGIGRAEPETTKVGDESASESAAHERPHLRVPYRGQRMIARRSGRRLGVEEEAL